MDRYRHPVLIVASALFAALSCHRAVTMNYGTADPVADARQAFAQDDYRVLGVRVHDTVLTPIDSTLPPMEVNVQLPNGPVRFLNIAPRSGASDQPSDEQLSYMKRYNTEMWRQMGDQFGRPRRP